MKSYNHLWEKFFTKENYTLGLYNATKHKGGKKRRNKRAKRYRKNADKIYDKMMNYIIDFKSDKHTIVEINDGISKKKRNIIVPTMREQIVHHMVINILKPIFLKSMYEHAYGSVPGRGAHDAKKFIVRDIKKSKKDMKYCLKMDIKKFFDSIPRKILKEKLKKIIHDEKFLNILFKIIDVDDKENGIPIGFYTSQWFANFYLTKLDHFIKEDLKVKIYYRYMDDIAIFGSNKKELHKIKDEIKKYLNDELGLKLKENWQIFLFHYIKKSNKEIGRDLDFMGFRFFRNRTILRKCILFKMTRKAKRVGKKPIKTIYDCRQMLSYLGWIDCTNTYNIYKKRVKPFICFQHLKRRTSIYQKRINIEEKKRNKICGM